MSDLNQTKSANFDLSSIDLLDLTEPFFSDDHLVSERDGEKYIVFFLGTEIYAILSKRVAEIFQPLAITPLPNFPDWLIGISNFRNDIISVIDLQKLWGKIGSPVTPKTKLIVLRPEGAESPVALTIDRLSEMVTLPERNIETVKDDGSPHIYGRATHKSNTVKLVDTNKLLSSLNL
ncbi:MAG: chemotaxis protein CheW [Pyrinomonadaceae bacterium]